MLVPECLENKGVALEPDNSELSRVNLVFSVKSTKQIYIPMKIEIIMNIKIILI